MLGIGTGIDHSGVVEPANLKEITGNTATTLQLWLQNDTEVTTAQWKDSSGNDNHATQSSEANQAAVSGGGLDFESTESDHYDLTTKIDIADNQGFCVALVVTRESEVAGCLLSDGTAELLQLQTARKVRLKTVNTGGEGIVTDFAFTSDIFDISQKFLLLINRSAGATNRFTLMKNGVALTPDTDTSSNEAVGENASGIEFTVLGARDGSSNHFDGIVHELAVWNRALTAQEIADVNSYLQEIHGL